MLEMKLRSRYNVFDKLQRFPALIFSRKLVQNENTRAECIKISRKIYEIWKSKRFALVILKMPKIIRQYVAEILRLERSIRCRSDRYRREVSNLLFEPDPYSKEYLVAKSSVDTTENEPLKVRWIAKLRDLIFAYQPRLKQQGIVRDEDHPSDDTGYLHLDL